MAYTYSESKNDLIINKISKSIYKKLEQSGQVKDDEIYIISDLVDGFATSANVSSIVDGYNFTQTFVDGKRTDISAVHISEEEFNKLVKNEGIISNVIYAIEYEDDNMYGERIRNVADPVEDQDAATKKYVDDRLINSGGGDDYVLTSVIPVDFEGGLCCQIENYKITTILISNPSKTLSVILPGMTENNKVRDFVIRFENTGNENASIAFVPQNDEDIDYESDLDDWAIVEPGINLISFTETKR